MIKKMERMNVESRPLTRLPGNIAIERVLGERLKEGETFALCHVNLENFKPFCAQYGYVKGGHLLRVTGYLLHGAVNDHGAAKDFVGHAGGDNFVMVLSVDKVGPVCDAVVAGFDAEVVKHYSAEELQAGGIERLDRQGVARFSPIATISIAVIDCSREQYASAVEICRAAADMTESVRKTPGSNWILAS